MPGCNRRIVQVGGIVRSHLGRYNQVAFPCSIDFEKRSVEPMHPDTGLVPLLRPDSRRTIGDRYPVGNNSWNNPSPEPGLVVHMPRNCFGFGSPRGGSIHFVDPGYRTMDQPRCFVVPTDVDFAMRSFQAMASPVRCVLIAIRPCRDRI